MTTILHFIGFSPITPEPVPNEKLLKFLDTAVGPPKDSTQEIDTTELLNAALTATRKRNAHI